jgi:hypothetical protein
MSPVMTKELGGLEGVEATNEYTVVSNVFGKQLLNRVARSASTIRVVYESINASTAVLTNLRSAGAGRT